MTNKWDILLLPIAILGGLICCVPLATLYVTNKAYEKSERAIDDYKVSRAFKKHEFPDLEKRKRKRALTLPLEQSTNIFSIKRRQKTKAQNVSPLFVKLPTELRMLVWEHVLSGHEIKIKAWTMNGAGDSEPLVRPRQWWAIVRTCRKVYSETIDLLYSRTRFEVDNGISRNPLFKFRKSVLPHRWRQIRYMNLQYGFNPLYNQTRNGCVISTHFSGKILGLEQWPGFCKILETLPKLHELIISIEDPMHCLTVEKMAMMKNIKVEVTFQVVVNWKRTEDAKRLMPEGTVPFSILTKKEYGYTEDYIEVSEA